MRLVFAGTADFAVPSLQALVRAGHEVALVVTQPDRPGHRMKVTPPAVKLAAAALRLTFFQPERVREPEAVERIRSQLPELMVVVAYGQIIPAVILEIPARGAINVHASLLPRHRGAAPVTHALLAGDRVTGVTIMQMDRELDHGPILATRETDVGPQDDAPGLSARLAALGAALLVETIAALDHIQPREQEHAAASLAPKVRKADGELDWRLPADEIDRRVRAYRPWPGVTLTFRENRVKILRGRVVASVSGPPGKVLGIEDGGILVATGSGGYLLDEVQLPGRRPAPARLLMAGDA